MPNLPSAFTPVIAVDRDLPKPLQKIQIALTCFDVVKPQGDCWRTIYQFGWLRGFAEVIERKDKFGCGGWI